MATTAPTRAARGQRGRPGPAGRLGAPAFYALLLAGVAVAALPFYWMLIAATRRSATLMLIPPPLTPGDSLAVNYAELLDRLSFWRVLGNSLLVAVSSTALVLFFCSLAGYAFAKFRFLGRDRLFGFMLLTMMIPSVMGVVPGFIVMKWLGWLDTYLPLIIPGAANAFGIFWMSQYIDGAVPGELLDSARIDGAHEFRIYLSVALPLITPALGALAILTFLGSWNDFFWPLLILKDEQKYTVPVALASLQGIYASELGIQMLGAAFAVLPILVVFLLASRQFISGLTVGAVKGG